MAYRVLIVSADADDSSAMREMLVEAVDGPFSSERVRACGRVRLRAKRTRLRWYSCWKTPVMYQQRGPSTVR